MVVSSNEQVEKTTTCKLHKNNRLISYRTINYNEEKQTLQQLTGGEDYDNKEKPILQQ